MKFYTIFLVMFMTMTQTACFKKEKKENLKEGDLVTWKINDELVIKGHLGQRRKHIVGEFDAEFYHPNVQQFMGQFPIDYLPKKFDPISKGEVVTLQQNNTGNPFEFYLMLNGSWVEPTDEFIKSLSALDHEDQVRVKIDHFSGVLKNSEQDFKERMAVQLDASSVHKVGILSCFNSVDGYHCFGKSNNPKISGVRVTNYLNDTIMMVYDEFSYGGVKVVCVLHKKNINQIEQIDKSIWQLIDAWNVYPN